MTEEELATVQARFKNVKVCPLTARELAVWRTALYSHDPSYGTEPNAPASDWQRFLATLDVLEAENARLRAALDQLRNACAMVPAVAAWVPDEGLTYISARTCREVWEAVRAALNPPATAHVTTQPAAEGETGGN